VFVETGSSNEHVPGEDIQRMRSKHLRDTLACKHHLDASESIQVMLAPDKCPSDAKDYWTLMRPSGQLSKKAAGVYSIVKILLGNANWVYTKKAQVT
jgi:hypothetical protein